MNANNSIVLNFNNAAPVQSGLIFKTGDKGITFNLAIKGLDTTGMTAKIAFNRSNATSVEATISGSGEAWTYTTLGNEFAVPGVVVADVKFYNNDESQRVSTASFIFGVISDTMDGLGGGTAGYSDELEVLREEMEEAADTLEAYIEAYGDRGPLNPRGDYDSDEEYTVCDVVYHNNTSWINRVPCSGEEPTTSSAYWQKMIDAASGGAQELNDLDDVSVSSPTDGQAMIYDGIDQVWKNQAIPTGSATLAGLTDVSMSSPTDGQAMIYDGIDQVWKNQAIPTGSATLAGLTDVSVSSPTNGQVLTFNSVTNEWENQTNTAAGFKPYIVTTAATGATVTYSKGGTSITATEVSAGTFKADVTDYGTWTVTATLNGQTATTTVNVTSVGEYTAIATFFSATIAVTFPYSSGATCTCSATGQPTQTATGSPYTFTVGAAGTYTLTCTIDGVIKTETVTITTEGQSETATFAFGTINLTIADEFRSSSITCTDGNTTITKTAPAAGNSMAFYPPNTGTWTISGTYSSQTYSTTATITALATAVSATLALTPPYSIVSWATGTDAEIAALIAAADRGDVDLYNDAGWRVGDTRTVHLDAIPASGDGYSVGKAIVAQDIELVLMDRGKYTLQTAKASGKTVDDFVVGQKDSLTGLDYMNPTATTTGSWKESARRGWCNNGYKNALPSTLQGIFKPFKVVTAQAYNSSTNEETIDTFALFAEKEIQGSASYSNATEAAALSQISWYATSANRIKHPGGNSSITEYYWDRSPSKDNSAYFCCTKGDGTPGTYSAQAQNMGGLAPFGVI